MHIVLDLQACQSPEGSRRGIGRYSLSLAKAMAAEANLRGHRTTVLLNAAIGARIEFLRGQFQGILPQEHLVTWQALTPTASNDPVNAFRASASEVLRLQIIRQLRPDVIHVASLFDGWGDDVIATFSAEKTCIQAATCYDLIPLVHQEVYLSESRARHWYMEKVAQLRRADILLGISRFTCDEAAALVGIPSERLTDISGAVDDIFTPLNNAEIFRPELMHRYALRRPFIMYAGGFDARKNIGALIRAFALLPEGLRCAHQLVIVGGAPPPEQEALVALAVAVGLGGDELVFTGYVPDTDLVKLYNLCSLYVFPSLQEGFGLPALEAMSSGAVVIGSNTSSLPEVIGREDALFDPRSDMAIAGKMITALTDGAFRQNLIEHGREQCLKFSWDASASRALDAFQMAFDRRKAEDSVLVPLTSRRHFATAYLPAPGFTGVPSVFDSVTVYADSDCSVAPAEQSLLSFSHDRGRFDRVIIELADHAYCAKTLELAASGAVDIVLRDRTFGLALEALAASPAGRKLVVAIVYAAGGYEALRVAVDGGFSALVLGALATPQSLGALGRSQVISAEAPIEDHSHGAYTWRDDIHDCVTELAELDDLHSASDRDWAQAAASLSANETAVACVMPQWLIDISNLFVNDAGTGIQRVVRHVLDELIKLAPPGYRVEPVFLSEDGVFRYARSYCQRRYFDSECLPADEPIDVCSDDVYLGLDLVAHLIPGNINTFWEMRNRGVRQYFVLYDLLPVLRPDCFDPNGLPLFREWYESVAKVADGILCISRAVADEFESWLHQSRPDRQRPLNIGWFHLGADLAVASQTHVGGDTPHGDLPELGDRPTFLMVGTIEPRKGHAQSLAAFDRLWAQGLDVNLLIIGKPGWLVDEVIERVRSHPQRGKRLFWLEKAGDELLLAAYARASALLMASEGEGFGLPLIEAAHHGVPLIVRDLPVFREIAGEFAVYFSGYNPDDLAQSVRGWLESDARGLAPASSKMSWLTWREATTQLVEVIRKEHWVHRWLPGPLRRFAAFDYRFQTQVGHLSRGRMMTSGRAGMLLFGPYVQLDARRYKVSVYGAGSGDAWMDVCSSRGSNVHVRCEFVAPGTDLETALVEVELSLLSDVSDLEVRVGVDADTNIWLSRIVIQPVLAANAASGSDSRPGASVLELNC